ncbi:methylaspartate ammonia-lyase [Halosimplex pelagicum]|uniref:methylaspartate ammonia-lyase n=1 Tax=Halosimplex pelagicum TaxID=869886 RepID=A0A7D5PDU3_9EURY|nr:methylaspartate ammonia-lyase [Halosimplex pelagicum]QLH84422.1 methylaspartate ammonia-lyase [Halosimplex pelagicum]
MRIESVRATPGASGFYVDDQAAIKAGATEDGFAYAGDPVTEGFDAVRQAGEALIVEVELADGSAVRGDCAAVQYSGAGGRDPLFRAEAYRPVVEGPVADALEGRDPRAFANNAAVVESLPSRASGGGDSLHTALRYGVSQALLFAAARARRATPTGVLADALDTAPATEPVPVFGQSGDARRRNAEKMLLKGVPVLPHGLFNSEAKLGSDGERLVEYLEWLGSRAADLGPEGYEPRFHVDVYGTVGELFGPPYDRAEVVDYFAKLAAAADPYPLQVEGPMDAGDRTAQIRRMAELRDGLADAGVPVDIVADEWCNTLDDVRAFVDEGAADVVQVKTPDLGGVQRSARAVTACEGTDTRAYLGGTCNETAVSARACVHVALATDAAQLLAKPGMGFDEGYMVVTNEMRRTLARRERADPQVAADGSGGDRR